MWANTLLVYRDLPRLPDCAEQTMYTLTGSIAHFSNSGGMSSPPAARPFFSTLNFFDAWSVVRYVWVRQCIAGEVVRGSTDCTLLRLDSFKDLGVTFQSEMSFKVHIANQINKANSMLGIIKRNCRDIKQDAFIMLHKSLVRSHLARVC